MLTNNYVTTALMLGLFPCGLFLFLDTVLVDDSAHSDVVPETEDNSASFGSLAQAQFFENLGQMENSDVLFYGSILSGAIHLIILILMWERLGGISIGQTQNEKWEL